MPDPRQKLITDWVEARAKTLTNLQVFVGEVDEPLQTLANSDRVAPYVVIYPFGGTDGPDPNLSDAPAGDLTYGFQVNCGAGFRADCEFLIDQVRGLFNRWAPDVDPGAGFVVGQLRPPVGHQPGPLRRNDSVKPPRFWLPLQFTTVATNTTA